MAKEKNKFDKDRYKEAELKYQMGDWAASKAILEDLRKEFPQKKRVKSLLADVDEHIILEDRENRERRLESTRRLRRVGVIAVIALVIVGLIAYVGLTSLRKAAVEAQSARATQQAGLAQEFLLKAQAMLDQYRPADAQQYIESARGIDPDFPGLAEVVEEAKTQEGLESLYDEANQQMDDGDYGGALQNLQAIQAVAPDFRDVEQLAKDAQVLLKYGDLGIAGQYLFDAETSLKQGLISQDQLQIAQAKLDSSARLGPKTEAFKLRLEVLQSLHDALDAFLSGRPDRAVEPLEYIKAHDEDLFHGMTALLLQEAYLMQGKLAFEGGHFAEALGSYLLAEDLADNEAPPRVYEFAIQFNIASTLGKLGYYDEAAQRYVDLVNEFGLTKLLASAPAQLKQLSSAKSYFANGDYRASFLDFSNALDSIYELLPQSEVSIEQKASLLNIAIQLGVPQEVLVEVNNLDADEMFQEIETITTIVLPTD